MADYLDEERQGRSEPTQDQFISDSVANLQRAQSDLRRRASQFDSETSQLLQRLKHEEGTTPSTADPIKQKSLLDHKLRFRKIWRFRPESLSGIEVLDNEVAIIGGPDHAIVSHQKLGNIIKGPVGFTAIPSQIRVATLWRFNDLLTSTVPSTIMTPIPVLNMSLPLANLHGLRSILSKLLSL